MGRLLFWLILGFLFWFAVRLLLSRRDGSAQSDASEKRTGTGDSGAKTAQIPMLQCAYCGVHFSSEDAVTSEDGRVYCTSAHHALAHR